LAGKGFRYDPEIRLFRDQVSGRRVWQVTDHPSINHPTYFLQPSFTPAGTSLVFTSYRTGPPQLFEAGWPGGLIRQLTDGPPIHPFSPAIHPSGERVYFVRGGSVWSIQLDTLEEDLVTEFPNAQLGECSLSPDGEWFTAAVKQGNQPGLVTGRTDGSDARLIPFDRTVIHPQFHPLEPGWLIFAGDPAPRMFRVRRDGSGMECLYMHDNDEFVVHETFLGRTGNIVFTVWPKALRSLDWTSREIHTLCEFNAWHIAPNKSGTKVLCDTNHPDRGIHLIDVASGVPEFICASDASSRGTQWQTSRYALSEDFARAAGQARPGGTLSWMENATDTVYGPQWTHPHPSFSHDETLIAFASDRTGYTQVYVAELGQ
jgi:hypothetical protein